MLSNCPNCGATKYLTMSKYPRGFAINCCTCDLTGPSAPIEQYAENKWNSLPRNPLKRDTAKYTGRMPWALQIASTLAAHGKSDCMEYYIQAAWDLIQAWECAENGPQLRSKSTCARPSKDNLRED